jgi:DNA polymerase
MEPSKFESLQALQHHYAEIVDHPFSDFKKNKIVFGTGNLDSKLLFLGEGPGAEEDRIGEPFVGRAGQLLTKIIEAMGYQRTQVYITNVIKCRLENNRAPTPAEVFYDKKAILDAELAVVNPRIICCLGASAMYAMLGYESRLSVSRGVFVKQGNWLILPTYHPAYLLRNPAAKRLVWQDMQKIVVELKSLS